MMKFSNRPSLSSGWACSLSLALVVASAFAASACSEPTIPHKLLPRREPAATLTTRLALVIMPELSREALQSTQFMPTWHDCADRGSSGQTQFGLDRWSREFGDSGYDLVEALGPNGLRALNYGEALGLAGIIDLPWEDATRFDPGCFSALDRESWRLFLAELRPELPATTDDRSLREPNATSPSTYGFAVSALDHELRRLIYQVGSHLTLITVAPVGDECFWTISGPGADHEEVQSSLQKGRLGDALGRLLGFTGER